MIRIPAPPIDGLTWRPAAVEDAPRLSDHTRHIHEAERLEALPGPDYYRWFLAQPGIDPDVDTLIALDGADIVADTGTWLHTADTGARCVIWAETSPGFEHLRPFLLEWAQARGSQRLEGVPADLPRVLRISVEQHRSTQREAIEASGFDSPRSFADMARSLSLLPAAPGIPADIEVIAWSDDFEESTRLASNASFADHWGSLPMSVEEFRGFFRDSPTFRPDLSFLAIERGVVVSFSLCEVDDEDNRERETDDVYVLRVGTVPENRMERLATHLIVRCMEAAVSAGGLDRVALQVDEMSHTNATLVYERLGFETYGRSLTYTRHL